MRPLPRHHPPSQRQIGHSLAGHFPKEYFKSQAVSSSNQALGVLSAVVMGVRDLLCGDEHDARCSFTRTRGWYPAALGFLGAYYPRHAGIDGGWRSSGGVVGCILALPCTYLKLDRQSKFVRCYSNFRNTPRFAARHLFAALVAFSGGACPRARLPVDSDGSAGIAKILRRMLSFQADWQTLVARVSWECGETPAYSGQAQRGAGIQTDSSVADDEPRHRSRQAEDIGMLRTLLRRPQRTIELTTTLLMVRRSSGRNHSSRHASRQSSRGGGAPEYSQSHQVLGTQPPESTWTPSLKFLRNPPLPNTGLAANLHNPTVTLIKKALAAQCREAPRAERHGTILLPLMEWRGEHRYCAGSRRRIVWENVESYQVGQKLK